MPFIAYQTEQNLTSALCICE